MDRGDRVACLQHERIRGRSRAAALHQGAGHRSIPVYNWTGFYVGLNGGYSWGRAMRPSRHSPVRSGIPVPASAPVPSGRQWRCWRRSDRLQLASRSQMGASALRLTFSGSGENGRSSSLTVLGSRYGSTSLASDLRAPVPTSTHRDPGCESDGSLNWFAHRSAAASACSSIRRLLLVRHRRSALWRSQGMRAVTTSTLRCSRPGRRPRRSSAGCGLAGSGRSTAERGWVGPSALASKAVHAELDRQARISLHGFRQPGPTSSGTDEFRPIVAFHRQHPARRYQLRVRCGGPVVAKY